MRPGPAPRAGQRSSALNVMRGLVERVLEEDETFSNVVVDVGQQALWARVTRRSMRELKLVPGRPVYATIKAASLFS